MPLHRFGDDEEWQPRIPSEDDVEFWRVGASILPAFFPCEEGVRLFCPRTANWVYRLWQESDLLYVGATMAPQARLLAHLRDERFRDIDWVTIQDFDDPSELPLRELTAIRREQPRFNYEGVASRYRGNGTWTRPRSSPYPAP